MPSWSSPDWAVGASPSADGLLRARPCDDAGAGAIKGGDTYQRRMARIMTAPPRKRPRRPHTAAGVILQGTCGSVPRGSTHAFTWSIQRPMVSADHTRLGQQARAELTRREVGILVDNIERSVGTLVVDRVLEQFEYSSAGMLNVTTSSLRRWSAPRNAIGGASAHPARMSLMECDLQLMVCCAGATSGPQFPVRSILWPWRRPTGRVLPLAWHRCLGPQTKLHRRLERRQQHSWSSPERKWH